MRAIPLPTNRMNRLLDTYRHPDRAAIVARMPVIGRSVPARAFWRRRPIKPARMVDHARAYSADALRAGRRTSARASARALSAAQERAPVARAYTGEALRAGRDASVRAASAAKKRMPRREAIVRALPGGRFALLMFAILGGALAMFYFDPSSGRRRRARVRDRLSHVRRVITRDVPRTAERRGRFMRGIARGIRHDAADILPHRHAAIDDETLVARVRSEALRRGDVKPGEIHVDAYEGCVTLRGQLERDDDIRRVVEATRRIEGVTGVRSYLHLPGTPPPNKAESLENGHAPARLMH